MTELYAGDNQPVSEQRPDFGTKCELANPPLSYEDRLCLSPSGYGVIIPQCSRIRDVAEALGVRRSAVSQWLTREALTGHSPDHRHQRCITSASVLNLVAGWINPSHQRPMRDDLALLPHGRAVLPRTELLEDVSIALEIPVHTLRRWLRGGKCAGFKIGGTRSWRLTRRDYDQLRDRIGSGSRVD